MTFVRHTMRELGTPSTLLILGIVAIASLLVFHYVSVNVVDVPFYDEWHTMAEVAVHTARGDLTFAHLTAQWNEHRPLVLYAYIVGMTWLTGWDIRLMAFAHVVVGMALAVAAAALVIAHVPRRQRRVTLMVIIVPVVLLVLSLRMRQIWLWGMQIKWTTGFLFAVGGLLAVRGLPVGWRGVIAAALASAGFSFTLAYGLLAWGMFPVVLWFRGYRNWRHYAAYLAIAVVTLATYFIGYDFSEIGVSLAAGRGDVGLATNPLNVIWFAVAMLGSPLLPFSPEYLPHATIIGLIGLAAFGIQFVIAGRRDRSLHSLMIAAVLAGFAIASGLLIGFGRAQDFPVPAPQYPLVDRYTQPAMLLWLGLLIVTAINVSAVRRPGSSGRWLVRGSIALWTAVSGSLIYTSLWTPVVLPFVTAAAQACVRAFPVERNLGCMESLFMPIPGYDPSERLPVINDLSALRLTAWRDPAVIVPYAEVIEFGTLPYTVTRQDAAAPSFAYGSLSSGWAGATLVMPATSQIVYALPLPATRAPLTFRSALVAANAAATFGFAVRDATGTLVLNAEPSLDPAAQTEPLAITADLSPYAGQTITLTLQVDSPGAASGVWLDPRVEVGVQS